MSLFLSRKRGLNEAEEQQGMPNSIAFPRSGMPYRPTTTLLLNLDTRFSHDVADTTPEASLLGRHVLPMPERLTDVTSLSLRSVELPVSFDTFSARLDNVGFVVRSLPSGAATEITLRDGVYSAAQLETEINAQLQAATPSLADLSFAIAAHRGVFSSSGDPFALDFASPASMRVRGRLGWLLGFRTSSVTVSSAAPAAAPCDVDAAPVRYLYIALDDQSMGVTSFSCPSLHSTGIPNVLARIALHGEQRGTMLVASTEKGNFVSDCRLFREPINIQRFTVTVLDERGTILQTNGADMSMLIQIKQN